MNQKRFCNFCERVLPSDSPGNKRHCNKEHARRARSETQKPKRDRLVAEMSDGTWLYENRRKLARAEQDILAGAPDGAAGFLAILDLGAKRRVFPEVGQGQRVRHRYDGSKTLVAGWFVLNPWEPPRVPETANYQIVYVTNTGLQIASQAVQVELPGCYMPKPRLGIHGYEIRRALLKHPGVAKAAVVTRTIEGTKIVEAFAQLAPGIVVTEAELIEFLRSRLSEYKWPQGLSIVDSIPVDEHGKPIASSLTSK